MLEVFRIVAALVRPHLDQSAQPCRMPITSSFRAARAASRRESPVQPGRRLSGEDADDSFFARHCGVPFSWILETQILTRLRPETGKNCRSRERTCCFRWATNAQLSYPRLQRRALHSQQQRRAARPRNPPLRLPQTPQNVLPLRFFQRRHLRQWSLAESVTPGPGASAPC